MARAACLRNSDAEPAGAFWLSHVIHNVNWELIPGLLLDQEPGIPRATRAENANFFNGVSRMARVS
jgi:hypothetical protein